MNTTVYTAQAEAFLSRNGIKFRATLSDSKVPAWDGPNGHHYRVTLSKPDRAGTHSKNCVCLDCRLGKRPANRLTFDFWGSKADADKGETTTDAYSVLACISSDAYCPETFKEFCAEYGGDEDSIKDLQTFRRCSRLAKRLREFFTASELEELSEIR